MTIFNIFLKYFSKNKLKKIQLFIQILICTIAILIFSGMLINLKNKLDDIESVIKISNIKGNLSINSDEDITEEINDAISYLKSESSFDFCQFVNQCDIDETNKLYIDEKLNTTINFSVGAGRKLTMADFNEDHNTNVVPVLISKDLEEKYPLNSEFKDRDTSFTNEYNYLEGGASFKVVGILNDDNKFWINDITLVDKLNYFNVIIYPTNFEKLEFNPPNYIVNLKSSSESFKSAKEIISSRCSEIQFIDSTLQESFLEKLQDKVIELIFIGAFTIILIILSLFGFISVIKWVNLLRTKEMGIYYSLGASMNNLLAFILSEIYIISFLAIIISYLLVLKFKDYLSLNYEILINNECFIVSFIIISIYILISSIIVSKSILKKEPIELIRE